jgi:NodT family efflux transporter outer membrane factor (OMF) lipoprotein
MLAGGCAVGPDYEAPVPDGPEQWDAATEAAVAAPGVPDLLWWQSFEDPLLDALIDRAVAGNLDLAGARLRVQQARALRGVAAAGLFPGVDARADAARYSLSENSGVLESQLADGGLIPKRSELYQAGFDVFWEIDVFGGTRRAIEAADARIAASEEARRGVLMSVLAETARNYVELRGEQRRLAITRKNSAILRQTLEIVEGRFRVGLAREIDVARARAQAEVTDALVPLTRGRIRAAAYRLAVLVGEEPGRLVEELLAEDGMPAPAERVPVGLPSELLRRRPDVRAAERQYAAATADVGVATADLFPRFFLTGSAGLESSSFSDLFDGDSETWNLGPAIRWPVFQGGRLRARRDFAEALAEEAAVRYEATVLQALAETESALILYGEERRTYASLNEAARASARAAELAERLYEKGLGDFLTVLDAQRRLVEIQDQAVQSETRVLVRLIALYKALGGGWEVYEPPG